MELSVCSSSALAGVALSGMKILAAPAPSAEQLEIIGQRRPGAEIIRGAAGSGKTTTALLRLQNLSNLFRARHIRKGVDRPVKVLMLTFKALVGFRGGEVDWVAQV
jgi:Tfp pilus assembly pilus retraction ATPase PilT